MDSSTRKCAYNSCERGVLPEKRCSSCRKAWYCSPQCQKDDWIFHVFDCKIGQPISTVYHLARACRRDLIPVDPQTRRDYGFVKAREAFGGMGESKLLGVYIGLFGPLDVPPKEVRRWQEEGRLVEGIRGAFMKLPPGARGGYYPWIMQNQHILDNSSMPGEGQVNVSELAKWARAHVRAWEFIGGDPKDNADEIRRKAQTWSVEKQACWILYMSLVDDRHPGPWEPGWVQFGFVVAGPSGEEQSMAREYRALIKHCTFDEFHAAYASSSIPALFRRHRGRQNCEIADNPCFCDVMADSPGEVKSVWELKHYVDLLVASDAASRPEPFPRIRADYGYKNCRNVEERQLLDEAYKRLFMETSQSPLDLHSACIEGDLFLYIGRFVKFSPWAEKYKRLLRNRYTASGDHSTGRAGRRGLT
ncbi:hypothetical protein BN946_scf184747.g32 [Trametes cinnabarina]|uniref:MYND-type domain-containing protein n=1 Tax=Pycnoporus cinnabarinus TaxID=5643 RepID=A0A060SYA0_PYCCI|nr:hypothetical protein BN946_scf184747.g32 [Trametes cinnabarina]